MDNRSFLYGTAGWSYRDWEETVYPAGKPKDFNHLSFLAESFDFVEVNTSFYHVPSTQLTTGWANKTEGLDDFRFWIKLHQDFTHKRVWDPQILDSFKKSLEPLQRASKLVGILAQFPYSFKLSSKNMDYLGELSSAFNEYLFAIEFRHRSWVHDDVLNFLRNQNIIWVNIDQPVISDSLGLTGIVTHPVVTYVRLHGRNYKSWFSDEGRDARYDYNYQLKELTTISETVRKLAELAKRVFISGNNHYKGSAVKNLKALKKLMEKVKSS